ncbi:hypothetical protein J3P89_18260 [Pseudomonas sp. Z1-14]|uniref:hypothetical protein n=1 Tax=Pseudomonas sp. Z1-14 TaxID=2817409 RepID=UPI003DA91F35
MHQSNQAINPPNSVATQFSDSHFVSYQKSFHQSAAMAAAQMIRFQYTRNAKNEFRRECLEHLRASLSGSEKA